MNSLLRLSAALLACLLWVGNAGADAESARILHINSYHRGYSWSDAIEQGLRDKLAASGKKFDISVEYLDSRRFAYGAQIKPLAAAMAIKYRSYRPDVVVVSDNAAFDFAVSHREKLFPQQPIVFCGYNNFRPEVLKGLSNITGVNEEISIADTVAMALKIHPATTTLAFITSTGEASSKRISDIAETTVFPKLRERFKVVELKDQSLTEVRRRLAELPRTSLVFLSGQIADQGNGRALTPAENGAMVSGVSPFPVYTFWDFHLETGVLGGHILTGGEQGKAAAELVLSILAGASADTLPVVMTSPARDVFDYPVMKRFGVAPDMLPPDATLINRPVTLWDTHRREIIATLILVALQSALIIALLRAVRQRRQALAALETEQTQLEQKVEERTRALHISEENLKRLNETLDHRVQEEVAKNMEQERLLIHQSRLAAMGEMIGNIAHQWRQPLNALALLLANIEDDHQANELDGVALAAHLQRGRQYIDKMSTTIDDFRNFFNPNKAKVRFSLDRAAMETLNLVSQSLEKAGIAVRLESDPAAHADGFPNEFSQVLLNLMNNAKDAIQQNNGGAGTIHIAIGHDTHNTWVKISDDGGGIPAAVLPRIFDPYFTTKEKGTGVGLYMSRMIMEHMGGAISVENTGNGAEFTLRLALAQTVGEAPK